MNIETEFDLDEVVYVIADGKIHSGNITRISVDYHAAGLRSIMYEIKERRQYQAENVFKTRASAGDRLLVENGLEIIGGKLRGVRCKS